MEFFLVNDHTTDPGTRILLFTGEGKGKTTAAFGMVLRALGHGTRCSVLQFLKSDTTVGEYQSLKRLGVPVEMAGVGFVDPADTVHRTDHQTATRRAMEIAATMIAAPDVQLVVLDEICVAVSLGLVKESDVLALCATARPNQILVLTGRGATSGLIAMADTVTEMVPLKHIFDQRVPAQRNVEY